MSLVYFDSLCGESSQKPMKTASIVAPAAASPAPTAVAASGGKILSPVDRAFTVTRAIKRRHSRPQ